ncbi:hypothetical protein evm_007933 [Chilo suppressalis]|nr:hypothetical protein evm_007933 [Chilo suppressalis]
MMTTVRASVQGAHEARRLAHCDTSPGEELHAAGQTRDLQERQEGMLHGFPPTDVLHHVLQTEVCYLGVYGRV